MSGPFTSQVAWSVPFDTTTTLGAQINKPDVQEAIESIYTLLTSSSRAFLLFSYGGNANTGRYLEWFPALDTSVAPMVVVGALSVYQIVARTTSSSATGSIGFYNITPTTPVLLYTLTYTAQKQVSVVSYPPNPIFVLPANGSLAIRVTSGSINGPNLYISGQGG